MASDRFPSRPRILIVEDDLGTRYALERHFGALGIRTTLATTGREAIALFDSLDIDAVVLDLKLPDMRGDVVLAHIRGQRGQRAEVPVVLVTGYAAEEDLTVQASFQKPAAPSVVCLKAIELLRVA